MVFLCDDDNNGGGDVDGGVGLVSIMVSERGNCISGADCSGGSSVVIVVVGGGSGDDDSKNNEIIIQGQINTNKGKR